MYLFSSGMEDAGIVNARVLREGVGTRGLRMAHHTVPVSFACYSQEAKGFLSWKTCKFRWFGGHVTTYVQSNE